MGELSVWHWLVVGIVVLILFGSKRLPDAARGVGRSLRILKAELATDDKPERSTETPARRHAADDRPDVG
jgi:sec-independent protein translocase protein TatA